MKRVKNGTGYVNAKCLFWLQYVLVWLFSYCSSLKQLQITIWLQVILCQINIFESIICRNEELSSTMPWVGCLLKESEFFLFVVNSQILHKNSVISGSTYVYFILSFVFCQFWRRSYQNQLSFSGKDSTADFFHFSSFWPKYEKKSNEPDINLLVNN